MRRTIQKNLALLGMLAAAALPITAAAQTVTLKSGAIRGSTDGDVETFKGIPFAQPPVGELRWRAPQPAAPWKGVRDATRFGQDCMQNFPAFAGASNPAGTSEDCLFVNVWRPANIAPGKKLPVMVWIYGGGFVFGSGAQPSYDGAQFARQGVILVSPNYRLGRFGFFAFPGLGNQHPGEPTGNFAFMDQIAALRWVKANIARFGGDPGNVTIFGESAGGVSVHNLLTSPQARGLFHKAIIESGGGRDGTLTARPLRGENIDPNYPVSAEMISINFARSKGIDGTDANALARLRALSAAEVLDGGQETAGPNGPRTYSGPILDGKVVTETAQSAYAAARQARVPLIIGSNSAEVPGGFLAATNKQELFDSFGKGKAAAISAYDPDGTADFAALLSKVTTDRVWAEPARLTARTFAKAGVPVYLYRFSYVADSMKDKFTAGAPHATEIDYVFDTVAQRYGTSLTTRDRSVARMMNGYWANFSRTGDPNGPDLPQWPRFTVAGNELLDFCNDGSAHGGPDPERARIDATELSEGKVVPR